MLMMFCYLRSVVSLHQLEECVVIEMVRTGRPRVVIHLCIEIVDRGCVARKLKLGYSAVGKD